MTIARSCIVGMVAIVMVSADLEALAGGFEVLEQSPTGVAMAGAGAARADDAAAVFYNPAGMAMQHGLALTLGGTLSLRSIDVTPAGGAKEHGSDVSGLPTVFVTQRLGAHFAVGIGVYSNFASAIRFDATAQGRFSGTSFYLSTVTVNPSVAIRPIPRLSIGIGLDVMPVVLRQSKALAFPGFEGSIDIGSAGTALGANAGVLVQIVKRYLDLGVTYRSITDADAQGHANLSLPSELAATTSNRQDKIATITFPHNLTFALHSRPVPRLSLAADVHLALWSALQSLDIRLEDPAKPAGRGTTLLKTPLDFKTTVGVRVGGEYLIWNEQIALRLGIGYDRSPVPATTLSPALPDGDRVLAGGGIGLHFGGVGLDVGYQAVIVLPRDATNPDFPARYESLGHLVGIAMTIRAPEVGGRLNDPDYKH